MSKFKAPQTVAASNGIAADKVFSTVTPPIYLSSTFGFEQSGVYEYTRTANPNRDILADTLAKLEGAPGQSWCRREWQRSILSCRRRA